MRISTSQINSSGLQQLLNRQSELQSLQEKISLQRRFLTPADDPVAATTELLLDTDIALIDQFNRNADFLQSANQLEETTLNGVSNIYFRLKELIVSLGNGTYSQDELLAVKVEIQERRTELIGLANTQNSSGDYLFSGFLSQTKPFILDAAGNVNYQGDQGQRFLKVSSGLSLAMSDSGYDVFVDVLNGDGGIITGNNAANTGNGIITPSDSNSGSALVDPHEIRFTSATDYDIVNVTSGATIASGTYTPDSVITFAGVDVEISGAPATGDVFTINPSSRQSVFATLNTIITAIDNFSDTDAGRATFRNHIIAMSSSFDSAATQVDTIRAKIGSRLNAMEQERNTNLGLKLSQQTTLSKIRDLDLVEAATQLAHNSNILEAAQASFARIQNLTLFNFI